MAGILIAANCRGIVYWRSRRRCVWISGGWKNGSDGGSRLWSDGSGGLQSDGGGRYLGIRKNNGGFGARTSRGSRVWRGNDGRKGARQWLGDFRSTRSFYMRFDGEVTH